MNENIIGNGGNPSYKGYEYQKVVTTWVALTLFFNDDLDIANGIIVEPASNEDIEADLNVPPEEAMATIVVPQAEKLMIQIKFRGSGYWSNNAFVSLVEDKAKKGAQGPAPRLRAKSLLLADPARRYVLLTNISVDNALSGGRIDRIYKKPPKPFIPEGVAKGASEKANLVGRFGIIECLTPQVVAGEIRHLLESEGHVPSPNVEKAVDGIKRAIEDRLLGLSSPLTRNEVLAIIENCGGLPHPDRELSEYVPPTTAESARNTLARENVVLLAGPPGFGKSLTAKQLVMELRFENPPFDVIRQTAGLEEIDESLRTPGRHVFYLDDPWGQSKLEFDANRWSIELPNLLRRASPDKKFVITSRTDILRLAFVKTDESPWKSITCTISKGSYDSSSRWDILTRKLKDGGHWRNDFVCQYRSKLLRELENPLALDRFAKALLAVPSADKAGVNELVEQAQIESITRIVAEQVKGWPCHGVACGTILWVLLRLGGKASPARLKSLRRALEKISPPLELDLEGFVDHLKPVSINEDYDRTLSAHGKVIDALEQVVKHFHVEAERSINRVLVAYQLLLRTDETYIDELLSVLAAVNSVRTYGIEIDADIIHNIDALLLDRLTKAEGRDFFRAFGQISRFASQMHPLARLVRYLGQGAPNQKQEGFATLSWVPPQVTASEIAAICAKPLAKVVIARFIATVLPYESEKYYAPITQTKVSPWLVRHILS
jgi:DNA polymerase III delta prime subunit